MWITIVCVVLLAAWVFFAVRAVRRKKGGCACGCAACGRDCPYREKTEN